MADPLHAIRQIVDASHVSGNRGELLVFFAERRADPLISQSDPASLRAIINAFSTLVHLDIANVLPAPVLFHSSSASPVEHLHAETRQFLQWISEQTTIETFIVRYPMKKEILRFKREGDLEEEAESSLFGFSCELWHEW